MSQPRVYFYCCPEPNNLQDDIIILAEGLRELGIPYYSSADYWRQSPDGDDYLFRRTPEVLPDDCDVVVLPYTWFNWVLLGEPRPIRREVPEGLFKRGRRYRTRPLADMALVMVAMVTAEGIGKQLNPHANLFEDTAAFIGPMLAKRAGVATTAG